MSINAQESECVASNVFVQCSVSIYKAGDTVKCGARLVSCGRQQPESVHEDFYPIKLSIYSQTSKTFYRANPATERSEALLFDKRCNMK